MLEIYRTKVLKIAGTKYSEVYKAAFNIFKQIKSKSKRAPYIRSKYFRGEKIFLELFWVHLRQKHRGERLRRLKYYSCGLDLLKNSRYIPLIKINPENSSEKLYRFKGITKNGYIFFVQVKEDKNSKQKYFMSVFPEN